MALKQKNRLLNLKTPLGEDVLLLTAFRGQEEISRLFRYELDLISDNNAVAARSIVGKNVTFSVERPGGSRRFFNGFVSRFVAGDEDSDGRRNYRAEVVPWLWFLTRTADCRIFQQKKVPQIIEKIFQDLGWSHFEIGQIKGQHPQRDYCVQYRETDFNFVSRLMEEEGIFYFCKHEDGKHTLVLADQKGAYQDCPESEVSYPRDYATRAVADHLTRWEHRYEFTPGKWAQTDYNFEDQPARSESTPSKLLMANEQTTVQLDGIDKYEVYDYPGAFAKKDEGKALTKIRMEEEEAAHDVVEGASFCKTFSPGGKFKIKGHRSKSEDGKKFVITSIRHEAVEPTAYETGAPADDHYKNTFTCIPDAVTFRPARLTRRPFVQGVQPAVVTGPGGEEIYTDKHGRVKIQFFWDREGKRDDKSSCWVRVSQSYAGKAWGAVDIPRIGQEVLVDFLEGDPDRPIIIGRVYNADQTPPYPLPGKKMVSGLKSNSTLGGGGYNEFILDDTKGNELIREHGQYDKDSTIEHDLREHVLHDRSRDVTHNETILVGNDRAKTIDHDETSHIKHDRTETVDNNETITIHGNRTETVDKDEKITINGGRTENVAKDESITINGGRTENVAKDEKITIGGGRTENVSKDESITIGGGRTENVSKNEGITIGGGRTLSVAKNESISVQQGRTVSVGKTLAVTAADAISLTTGSASIVMKKDGTIIIKGKDIMIQGSGQIIGKAGKNMVLKGQKILQN